MRRRRALQEVEEPLVQDGNDRGSSSEPGFHDMPVSAGKDEVYGWLRTMRMEKLRPGLASKGVAALDDLKYLTKSSLKGLGLTKLAEKRFWSGVRDLRLAAYAQELEFVPKVRSARLGWSPSLNRVVTVE